MKKRNRRKHHPRPVGTGLGQGHGGNSELPDIIERPLSALERRARAAGQLEADLKCYGMGAVRISVGCSHLGYHLSVAHPKRYPTWDECAKARYELLPADVTFGMLFPPNESYVNLHNYCFHLWEVVGLKENRKLEGVATRVIRALLEVWKALDDPGHSLKQTGDIVAATISECADDLRRWGGEL